MLQNLQPQNPGQVYLWDSQSVVTFCKVRLGSMSAEIHIFPSLLEWIPGLHQIFWNFEELWVFIYEQTWWHQQTRQTRQLRDFRDCFLDQMDKVQVPATLNSSCLLTAGAQRVMQQCHLLLPAGTTGPGEPLPRRDTGDANTEPFLW